MRFLFIAFLLLSISACSLFNTTSKNELGISAKQLKKTTILVDVGRESGTMFDEGIFANSFESVAKVLKENEGVKIDLQISKDSTLWLFSEKEIRDCKFQKFKSLCEYDDAEINFASICWYEEQLIPLDTFINLMEVAAFKDKFISFNLKSISDTKALNRFGGEEKLAELMAKKLKVLNQLKNIEFIVEIPSKKDTLVFSQFSNFTSYYRLTSEQAKITNYPRLSVPILNASGVKADKALQVWGANIVDHFIEALKLKPDYIQTTDLKLANFIKNSNKLKSNTIENDSLFKEGSDTLFSAILKEKDLKKDFILELSIKGEGDFSNISFSIHGYNSNEQEVFWESKGIQIDRNFYRSFFSLNDLKKRGCKEIRVYVVGKNKAFNSQLKIISVN